MRKILFLDIDGPIAPDCHKEEDLSIPYVKDISPAKINILKAILKKHPQYEIVMISDWRHNLSLEQFKELFSHFQIKNVVDVVSTKVEKDLAITEWLKLNKNIENFVIIDDDVIFDLDHEWSFHQLKTSLYSGLLEFHIEIFDELADQKI